LVFGEQQPPLAKCKPTKKSPCNHFVINLAFASVSETPIISGMSEIVNFVNRGAGSITPAIMEKVLRQLPQWKLEFTQIYAPLFPHLVDQLEFLADAVEDTAEGIYKDLPYFALAEAVFALVYAHKKVGIIPDTILTLGRADDSSIVRAVLIQNEKTFALYAASQKVDWSKVTSSP